MILNTLIVFTISGFWHGANWTFIVWGLINAIYFIPQIILKTNRKNLSPISKDVLIPSINDLSSIIFTFFLTVFAWIFFRANDLNHAIIFIYDMFNGILIKSNFIESYNLFYWKIGYVLPILIALFFTVEWLGRLNKYAIEKMEFLNYRFFRWSSYLIIIFIIWIFGKFEEQEFIYFQF